MKFQQPSKLVNEKKQERKVGFEFEFSGLNTEETSAIVVDLFKGRIEKKNRFDIDIEDTQLGKFSVALDARAIKSEKYLALLEKLGVEVGKEDEREWWSDLVEKIANLAVPYEIGTPPIPISRLDEVEKLRQAMQERNAVGTKARYQYAFGMHLNPEVPDTSLETTLAILRSFLVHYPWLVKELEIDLARRVAPFINPFPDAYFKLVLDPSYRPSRDLFMQDYLEHNSRNRPLDLLPLFCFWDEGKVREKLPEEKINARPAYHYRMPNCLFDDPDWRLSRDWNYWVRIEELAWDGELLNRLSLELLNTMEASPLTWSSAWTESFQKEVGHG